MLVSSNRSGFFGAVALLAIVGFFAALMAGFYVPAFDGIDENGYLVAARNLALHGDSAKHTDNQFQYVSENIVQVRDGVFYAKYPLGYPALCAAAYNLGGESAMFLVNPLLAALAIVGMFFLARAMINTTAGVLGALLLATNPLHAYFGLSALSHSGSICFAVWGMFFLWRWTTSGGWLNAALAGALSAVACTIRYTEALLALPAMAMIIWRLAELRKPSPFGGSAVRLSTVGFEAGVMATAAFVAIAPLLVHHWIAFGAPWRTGYALCGEATGFGWHWFKENWWLMLNRLNSPGLMLLFPLGVAGLAYLATHDAKRATFLGLWLLPPLLLYTAYYWAPQGEGPGYVRFFVSLFPPLIVGVLVLLIEAVRPRPLWIVAVGGFVLLVTTTNLRDAVQLLGGRRDRLVFVQQTTAAMHQHLPENAVVMATGRVLNFVELAGNYELYSLDSFDRSFVRNRTRVLTDANPHPFQRDKAVVLSHALGDKTDPELADMERALLATNLAAGRAVAVVTAKDGFRQLRGKLGGNFQFNEVQEWVEDRRNQRAEDHYDTWALYSLKPREIVASPSNAAQAVEEKIDEIQFKLKTTRAEFDERYPGARDQWAAIQDMEKQVHDLEKQLKNLKPNPPKAARKPAPVIPPPATTNPVPVAAADGGSKEARP
jgi:4-amino-4-deoxy-L-arabinose transferase-like glycosyltransferase